MAPFLASREFPMTLQFVHGGVDRDGAPLHFHIRDGRISGLNGETAPDDGAECVDLQGFAVRPGWSTATFTSTRALSATVGTRTSR